MRERVNNGSALKAFHMHAVHLDSFPFFFFLFFLVVICIFPLLLCECVCGTIMSTSVLAFLLSYMSITLIIHYACVTSST